MLDSVYTVKRGGVTGIYRDYIMTNRRMEMKLLRAFIDASGFDVKEVVREAAEGQEPDFFILDDDYCVDYKVTSKECLVPLPAQSKAWGCVVDFVLSHREDIINDVNDYGGLGSILDFMERKSN